MTTFVIITMENFMTVYNSQLKSIIMRRIFLPETVDCSRCVCLLKVTRHWICCVRSANVCAVLLRYHNPGNVTIFYFHHFLRLMELMHTTFSTYSSQLWSSSCVSTEIWNVRAQHLQIILSHVENLRVLFVAFCLEYCESGNWNRARFMTWFTKV